MTTLAHKLGRYDSKLIARERFLVFLFIFIIYMIVVLRFGLPWLDNYLAVKGVFPNENISSRVSDYYPLIVAFFALFEGALLAGTVFGFLLLDEKDNNTIKAILITPVTLNRYMLYRITIASMATFIIVLAMLIFINQALLPWWQLILVSIGASFTTPIVTLFYAVYAENKVQGFAYAKFVSVAGWVILIAWFVSNPFQWLFGLFPPFWISKAYWMAFEGNQLWWISLIIGIVSQVALIILLLKRFNKIVYS